MSMCVFLQQSGSIQLDVLYWAAASGSGFLGGHVSLPLRQLGPSSVGDPKMHAFHLEETVNF